MNEASGTRYWQNRAVGHLLKVVYEAHDFMGATCREDERGFITEKRKRSLVKITTALIPWYRALSQVLVHAGLEKLTTVWGRGSDGRPGEDPTAARAVEDGAVVYVRVHLHGNEMYVGRTEHWRQRVVQHYMKTHRHSDRCSQRCRGCDEHRKYQLHRKAAPHMWMTIPVAVCADELEMKKMERKLILSWQPTLNECEAAPWLMKHRKYDHTYARDLKRGSAQSAARRTHDPPWKRTAQKKEDKEGRIPWMSVYKTDEETRLDCEPILKAKVGSKVTITVTPGSLDVTSWPSLRAKYGGSAVMIHGEPGSGTTLEAWRPRGAQPMTVTIEVEEDDINTQPADDLSEVASLTKTLSEASEECLTSYWTARNALDKKSRIRVRTMIWDECERRYDGFTRRPIEIRMPYFREVDAHALRRAVSTRLDATGWPAFLVTWHKARMRIVSESPRSIESILCNVNHPTKQQQTCCCAAVYQRMQASGRGAQLPEVDGHICTIGREFPVDQSRTLGLCASNVPRQTQWDLERAWQHVRRQLPEAARPSEAQWKSVLRTVQTETVPKMTADGFPTTRDVYCLRKVLDGLVIGPLDKNKGELWMCCPVLYQQALRKLYSDAAGYEKLHVAALTPYRRRAYKDEQLEQQICRTEPVQRGKPGGVHDIVALWKRIYKARGWSKYAAFDSHGGFNRPYALLKAKNMTDPKVRAEKWSKARPIAPGTKHPMRRLLHLVGRAWYFLAKRDECGDSFVIERSEDVPRFLATASSRLSQVGPVAYTIKDIEGCYPHMPKPAIRMAMREHVKRIEMEHEYRGVSVPRFSDVKPCTWERRKGDHKHVWIPFKVMLEVMDFALDHAILQMPDGSLRRQKEGIPMGDPLSPAMTVITCAWMEDEWLKALATQDKMCFAARRFMDDILMLYAQPAWWDHKAFVRDFTRSEIYWPPLKLEDAKEATFLETTFELGSDGHCEYWLKNDNERERKVWRYQHYRSHAPYGQKRATLVACLRKVHKMASDRRRLYQSAMHKLREFQDLAYPTSMLRAACNLLAASTGERTWLGVRNSIADGASSRCEPSGMTAFGR